MASTNANFQVPLTVTLLLPSRLKLMIIMITFQAIVYALQRVRHLSNTDAEKRYKQKIRWTKEEMTIAGEDLMRNACNIAPEDKVIYRAKVDRLAKRLSL